MPAAMNPARHLDRCSLNQHHRPAFVASKGYDFPSGIGTNNAADGDGSSRPALINLARLR